MILLQYSLFDTPVIMLVKWKKYIYKLSYISSNSDNISILNIFKVSIIKDLNIHLYQKPQLNYPYSYYNMTYKQKKEC